MSLQELLAKYLPLFSMYRFPLIVGFVGLIFLGYGLIVLLETDSSSENIVFESETQDASSQKEQPEIVVDIQGAVINPGVYKLPLDSRVQDGLVASGGLQQRADRTFVSKNLNLAAKLADGTKLYIPFEEEQNREVSISQTITSVRININTASLSQIESLPKIGSVTAQKIVDNRPYASIDELLSKKVVGVSVFGQIKEKISPY